MSTKRRNILLQSWVKLMRFLACNFPANSIRVWALRQCGFSVGRDVYIASGLMVSFMNSDTSCKLTIGDRVSIGPRVTIILASDANHSKLVQYFPAVRGSIVIENDAWLGAGVILLPNINIGECAVIAAGAVVNANAASFSVNGGVPAKEIRKIQH